MGYWRAGWHSFSARVVSNSTISFETFSNVQMVNVTYDQFVLAHDTLTDEEAAVSSDGQVRLVLPSRRIALQTLCVLSEAVWAQKP